MDSHFSLFKRFFQKVEELCKDPVRKFEKGFREDDLLKDKRVKSKGRYR